MKKSQLGGDFMAASFRILLPDPYPPDATISGRQLPGSGLDLVLSEGSGHGVKETIFTERLTPRLPAGIAQCVRISNTWGESKRSGTGFELCTCARIQALRPDSPRERSLRWHAQQWENAR